MNGSPNNGITLSGWGATLRVLGRDIMVVLAMFGLTAVIVLDRRDRLTEQELRRAEHQAILDAQRELACMIAVPLEPREYRLEAAQDRQGACHYIATIYQYRGIPLTERRDKR